MRRLGPGSTIVAGIDVPPFTIDTRRTVWQVRYLAGQAWWVTCHPWEIKRPDERPAALAPARYVEVW